MNINMLHELIWDGDISPIFKDVEEAEAIITLTREESDNVYCTRALLQTTQYVICGLVMCPNCPLLSTNTGFLMVNLLPKWRLYFEIQSHLDNN